MYSQCFSSVYFFGSGSNLNFFFFFCSLLYNVVHSVRLVRKLPLFSLFTRKVLLNWVILQWGTRPCVLTPEAPINQFCSELDPFFFFLRLLYDLRKTHIVIAGLQLLCSCVLTGNSLVCSFVYLHHSNTCAGLAWGREPALCYSQENVTVHLHMDGKGRKVQGCSFAASPDCPLTTLTRPLETFCQNLCTKSA